RLLRGRPGLRGPRANALRALEELVRGEGTEGPGHRTNVRPGPGGRRAHPQHAQATLRGRPRKGLRRNPVAGRPGRGRSVVVFGPQWSADLPIARVTPKTGERK